MNILRPHYDQVIAVELAHLSPFDQAAFDRSVQWGRASTAGGESVCEECEDGTFTEHDNGLKQCFKCAQCRSDQEVVRRCSHTQETECRCRAGRFCSPDEACEVCRRCSR
ncbi:Tumor necrosis factor receptor superfamily member 22 [Dissostichus eleginoides]|uniref:Tumor necrosis factor receptor superfamily member 22 n=1 Tax=Dissostichus eleginoides TaxID=100907 RepID=A0AAD9BY26_DISEL|nr:Tumor necrosis factor receptor superfamily member 22 [Dissostichus eleginoides]